MMISHEALKVCTLHSTKFVAPGGPSNRDGYYREENLNLLE